MTMEEKQREKQKMGKNQKKGKKESTSNRDFGNYEEGGSLTSQVVRLFFFACQLSLSALAFLRLSL
jgi:hypothetical protein